MSEQRPQEERRPGPRDQVRPRSSRVQAEQLTPEHPGPEDIKPTSGDEPQLMGDPLMAAQIPLEAPPPRGFRTSPTPSTGPSGPIPGSIDPLLLSSPPPPGPPAQRPADPLSGPLVTDLGRISAFPSSGRPSYGGTSQNRGRSSPSHSGPGHAKPGPGTPAAGRGQAKPGPGTPAAGRGQAPGRRMDDRGHQAPGRPHGQSH
jgi:hypothetical protein